MFDMNFADNFFRPIPGFVGRKARRVVRATILYGFVGLISVGAFSGCGLSQGWRTDGKDNSNGTNNTTAARKAFEAPTPTAAAVPTKVSPNVIVKKEYRGPTESTPTAAAPVAAPLLVAPAPQWARMPTGPAPARPLAEQTIEPPAPRIAFVSAASAEEAPDAPAPISPAVERKEQAVPVKKTEIPKTPAEKFWTVTGTVEAFRKTWRVRYAAVDQEDRYGGVVVLDGGAELNPLRDGMRVRVRGTLIPATDRTGSAHYRVQSLQILD
jgi:hypothetical protein